MDALRKFRTALVTACAALSFVCMHSGCVGFHINDGLRSASLDWPMAGRTASGTYADPSQQFTLPFEPRWEYDLSAGTSQNAFIIVDSILLCGTLRGEIIGVSAVDGHEIGTKKISVPIAGAPVTLGNQLFFCTEAGKETVYDYDLRAGEYVWRKNYGGIAASPIIGPVATSLHGAENETRLFVATLDGMMMALRPSDGEALWKTKCAAPVAGTPCMLDSLVYCADIQGTVYAFSASSGAIRWKKKLDGAVYAGLSARAGTVYAGSRSNTLYALDALTGAERWTFDGGERIMAAASVSDSLVIVPALNGSVFALGLDGREKWHFSAHSAVNVPAVIVKDVVIVASLDTYIYALSAADGTVRWKHSIDARIKTVPLAWNNSLFVIGDDRTIYRFMPK